MLCAPLSLLSGLGRTGCNGIDFLVHTITHANHINISAIPAPMIRKINFTVISTGNANSHNGAHDTEKLLPKMQVHDVNISLDYITVQDLDRQIIINIQ